MKVTAIYCFAQKETVELPFVNNDDYKNGDMVIFANKEGKEEAGKILIIERDTTDEPKILADSSVLRKMGGHDIQMMETNVERGKGIIAPQWSWLKNMGWICSCSPTPSTACSRTTSTSRRRRMRYRASLPRSGSSLNETTGAWPERAAPPFSQTWD